MNYRKQLGSNIRNLRKTQKLSIKELAIKSKLTEKYLNTVELGKNNISFDNLIQICIALKVEPSLLLRFTKNAHEELINKITILLQDSEEKSLLLYLKLLKDIKEFENE